MNRIFSDYGVYISIIFRRNPNREESWYFRIDDVEDCLEESGDFSSYEECKLQAVKKAVEYISLNIV